MPDFSSEQLLAIAIDALGKDSCIVAGPGSGKTTVLVERYRRLVVERGIPVSRILAITFTEKAANNMKERLGREPGLAEQMESAWVSTVHGFCLRLIRENAIAAGIDPAAAILDEGQGVLLQRRCLTETLDRMLAEQPDRMGRLMRELQSPELDLRDVYDAIRSAGVEIDSLRNYAVPDTSGSIAEISQLVASIKSLRGLTSAQQKKVNDLVNWHADLIRCGDGASLCECLNSLHFPLGGAKDDLKQPVLQLRELAEHLAGLAFTALHIGDRGTLLEILERFHRLFTARKRERGVLDFADLESSAVRLLEEHPHVRERVQKQFQQVLMDEFQDTNGQQARLLQLLRAPDSFYAVGDLNQSIFGFRHASPEVFRRYRDDVKERGRHFAELEENWRSRPEILHAAEMLLEGEDGVERRRLIAARTWPAKKEPSVELIAVEPPDDAAGEELEAQWLARRIRELHGAKRRPAAYKDMAVLVRNSKVMGTFAAIFEAAGIPCEQSRRSGFLETREARDLTHLLRVIENPRDELATAVVLRSPFVAVSDEALLRLEILDKNLGGALDRLPHNDLSAFDPVDRERLLRFREQLRGWRADQPYLALDCLILRALDESGYPWEPDTAAGANIEQFLELTRTAANTTLAELLEEIDLLRDAEQRDAETPFDSERDAVRMMTAHSAKGLEFPIVFVAAMHKGTDTTTPPFSFTPEHGLGASWRGGEKGRPDAFHRVNTKLTTEKEKQEENRLLYVALTRAEEHLILSYTRTKSKRAWARLAESKLVESTAEWDAVPHERELESPYGEKFRVRILLARDAPAATQLDLFAADAPHADLVARAPAGSQHESALTVTAVAQFADCPRRYYLGSYLGWQGRRVKLADLEDGGGDLEPGGSLRASDLGKAVHALLAGAASANPHPDALRLADTFRQSELGERADRATRIEREFSFLISIDGIIVRGQIDLWFEDSGGIVLVDYKTNDVSVEEAAREAEAYALQLHLYALVLERLTGRLPSRAYLHFLRPNVLIEIQPDPAAAMRTIESLIAAQDAASFPLVEAEHCHRCQFYRGMCPAAPSVHALQNPF